MTKTQKIVYAFERIGQAIRVLQWRVHGNEGLSPLQQHVLRFILQHPQKLCTVSALASEFDVRRPTMSDTVKALVAKGLVKKQADSADARSYTIALSDDGQVYMEAMEDYVSEMQQPIDQLSPADQNQLFLTLTQIIHALNLKGIISIQRMCFTCRFYSSQGPGQAMCQLLGKPLPATELRLDCEDHMTITEA